MLPLLVKWLIVGCILPSSLKHMLHEQVLLYLKPMVMVTDENREKLPDSYFVFLNFGLL